MRATEPTRTEVTAPAPNFAETLSGAIHDGARTDTQPHPDSVDKRHGQKNGHENRMSGEKTSIRDRTDRLPFVVAAVAAVGGLLALRGISSYPSSFSVFPFHVDPLYYLGTLFIHSGPSHYAAVMLFFVPAGLVLTYLASNRRVAYVVLASHLPTALVCSVLGLTVVGAGAAAYGLLAAVLVRAAWYCASGYSGTSRVAAPVAAVAVAGTALVAVTGGSTAAYLVPISGFFLGGAYEAARVLRGFVSEDDDKTRNTTDECAETPRFRSRWENTKEDGEDADMPDGKYAGRRTATPDDTYAGSGGRTRG